MKNATETINGHTFRHFFPRLFSNFSCALIYHTPFNQTGYSAVESHYESHNVFSESF